MHEQSATSQQSIVKSAGRVLDLLELLAGAARPFGVSAIARSLGIPKSSTQALLETLLVRGYIKREDKAYLLADGLEAGWIGGEFARLRHVAHAVMVEAVKRSGESAFIGIKVAGWRIRYVDKVISPNEVRYDGGLDHDRPAYCTSIGQLFLAAEDDHEIARYLETAAITPVASGTETDAVRLRALLEQVRLTRIAQSRNGHVEGASGVAAPIFGRSGRLIAGITLAAPTARFDRERAALIEITSRAADEITRALGGAGRSLRTPSGSGDRVLTAPFPREPAAVSEKGELR